MFLIFPENHIRKDHLTKMTEFTLEKLIPIAGERLDFLEKVELLKNKTSEHVNIKQALLNML